MGLSAHLLHIFKDKTARTAASLRQEQEHERATRKERRQAAQTAEQEQTAREAADREAFLALRPARDAHHRPLLESRLASVRNAYANAPNLLAPYLEQLNALRSTMKDVRHHYVFNIGGQTDLLDKLDYVRANPELVMHGTRNLTAEQRKAHSAAGFDLKRIDLEEAVFPHDIEANLAALLPPAEITVMIKHFKSPHVIDLTLTAASTQKNGHKTSISYQEGSLGYRSFRKPLTDRHVERALTSIVQWATEAAPRAVEALSEAFAKQHEKAAEIDHHLSYFGHTEFLTPEGEDDVTAQKARFEARFAASKARLEGVMADNYNLLPRPSNKDFLRTVYKQLRTLNGRETADGRLIEVKTDAYGSQSRLQITCSDKDNPLKSDNKQAISLSYDPKNKRFQSFLFESQKSTDGPTTDLHDAQYHFVYGQIGAWLKSIDDTLAKDFLTQNPEYAAPQKYKIAGHGGLRLKR